MLKCNSPAVLGTVIFPPFQNKFRVIVEKHYSQHNFFNSHYIIQYPTLTPISTQRAFSRARRSRINRNNRSFKLVQEVLFGLRVVSLNQNFSHSVTKRIATNWRCIHELAPLAILVSYLGSQLHLFAGVKLFEMLKEWFGQLGGHLPISLRFFHFLLWCSEAAQIQRWCCRGCRWGLRHWRCLAWDSRQCRRLRKLQLRFKYW